MVVCKGECMECSPWDEYHNCGLPQLYEAFEGWNSICGQAYNLKGKFSVFLLFYCSSFLGMMYADPTVVGGGEV